jgi:hypothetical protein
MDDSWFVAVIVEDQNGDADASLSKSPQQVITRDDAPTSEVVHGILHTCLVHYRTDLMDEKRRGEADEMYDSRRAVSWHMYQRVERALSGQVPVEQRLSNGDPQGQSSPSAGWYRDPIGRYEMRWWDGRQWTPHVLTRGFQSFDYGL